MIVIKRLERFYPIACNRLKDADSILAGKADFRIIDGGILVSEETDRDIRRWADEHFDITEYLKGTDLGKTDKQSILKRLAEEHLLSADWQGWILGKKFTSFDDAERVRKLADTRLSSDADRYLSETYIYNHYDRISHRGFEQAVSAGRIRKINKRFDRACVEAVLNTDLQYRPLSEWVGDYEERMEVTLPKYIIARLREELIRKHPDDRVCVKGSFLIIKNVNENELYCKMLDDDQIEKIVLENAVMLNRTNYRYLWKKTDPLLIDPIQKIFDCRAFEENPRQQNRIHKLLAAFLSIRKPLAQWNSADVEHLKKHVTSKQTVLDCKRVLTEAVRANKDIRFEPSWFNLERIRPAKETDSCIPYSYDQFIALGQLLFTRKYVFDSCMLERAIRNDGASQVLLYMAMHFVCAWRKGDICRLKTPDICDISGLISQILEKRIDEQSFIDIWMKIDQILYLYEKASKNKGELTYVTPPDFFVYMGIYVVIARYHQARTGRMYLMTSEVDKISNYTFLLGEHYTAIFGDKVFRNRKMNKQLLLTYARGAEGMFSLNIKTLPELVAAYLRGHKFDFENGQHTIFHYIGHQSDGLSVDAVANELFLSGTLGHYKHMVAKVLLPEYSALPLPSQTKALRALDIDPARVEMQLEAIDKMNADISSLGMVDDIHDFRERLEQRIRKEQYGANETGVFCLYSALSGLRKPDCIGRSDCMDCKDDSHLCRFGIYSWQYAYNLMYRCRQLDAQIETLRKEQLSYERYQEGYRIIENTLRAKLSASDHLIETVVSFVSSIDAGEPYKEALIKLFEDGGKFDALP